MLMSVDLIRMESVRRTLMQYGGSEYLRTNFFKGISARTWNAQVEPKLESFVANPNFVGYYPSGKLANSLEASLSALSNLIIKLEDEGRN